MGSLLVYSGAGLLTLSFFVPWWGIHLTKPKDISDFKKIEKAGKVLKGEKEWYKSQRIDADDMVDSLKEEDKVTFRIWGWRAGAGILGFVLTLLLFLPLAIVPRFVPFIQSWSWIGSFITALLGLIVLILALVWVFGAPSEEVVPILSQGISIGPYIYLLASLLVLGGGAVGGIFGLLAFVSQRKAIRS